MRKCFFVLLALVVIDNISLSQQKFYSEIRLKEKTFFLNDSAYTPERKKSPILAGITSFILPGLAIGQLVNGQYADFIIRILISGLSVLMFANHPPFISMGGTGGGEHSPLTAISVIVFAANWLSSVPDAVIYAVAKNEHIRLKNKYLKKQSGFNLNLGYDLRGLKLRAGLSF